MLFWEITMVSKKSNFSEAINGKQAKVTNTKKVSIIITGTYYRKTWLCIAEELKNNDCYVEFIGTSSIISKDVKKNNFVFYNMNDYLNKYNKEYTYGHFQKILKKLGTTNEDFYFTREKYVYGASTSQMRRHVYTYYKFFDWYYKNEKPDVLLQNGDDTLNLIAEKQGQKYDIKTLHTNCVGILPDTINWDSTIYHNSWVKEKCLSTFPSDTTLEQDYISDIIKKRPIIGINIRPVLSFNFAKKYLTLTYHYLSNGQCRHDYYNPLLRGLRWMMRIPNLKKTKKFYSLPHSGEKYIFFPLHVHNDAQTTLRAVQFFRQDSTAELIANALPKGLKLYVKQHPHGAGLIPLEQIKKIANLPNTRLVPPDINSHDLIEKSEAIITINSDVGWEGLLHLKPVIVLDKPFYSHKGITFDVDDMNHLTKYIQDAISKKTIPKEKLLPVVHAVLKSHYPGSFFKAGTVDFNLNPENIRKIVKSAITEMEEEI